MTHTQMKEMPKVELHCHLDGSISKACLEALLDRSISQEELQVGMDCDSLRTYLEKFSMPVSAIQSARGMKAAVVDVLEQAAGENVRYMEIRFAPLICVGENFSLEQVMEAVTEGVKEGYDRYGVRAQIIVCAMRHHSQEENARLLPVVKKYLGKGVCAMDLAGDEAAFPMEQFSTLFQSAYAMGIPFTIHAGECGRVENVMEAIRCGARRIGHGIALRGNRAHMERCKEYGVGIEMCPISNLQTKAVACKEEYPLREFLDGGLLVTINTDNRTVSNTNVTKELEWIQQEYDITDEELAQLQKNALEVSFAPAEWKEELRQFFI